MESPPVFIDSHAHLNWPNLHANLQQVIWNAQQANVCTIINVGIQTEDFGRSLAIQKAYPMVKSIIGIHPEWATLPTGDVGEFKAKFEKNRDAFVGVGEIGLDYWETKEPTLRERQQVVFSELLEIAEENRKPVVIHCRNAEKPAFKILEKNQFTNIPAIVLHCFGGSEIYIRRALDHENWYLSIPTSVVNRKQHQGLCKNVPLDRMMLETDSPFLPPIGDIPYNEPKFIPHAAATIAELKETTIQEIAHQTTQNAKKVFQL